MSHRPISLFSLALVGSLSLAVTGCSPARPPTGSAPDNVTAFARCLADRGVTMYGADWCVHCQRQKKMFGAAFGKIAYVECPANPQRCLQAGVNGYPTWVNRDGKKLEGEQSLPALAEFSGCPLAP